ncbi:MAG TPA: 2OG-Fe(II) oxygenase family protein [Steroidobacteraceae bacterium]|nr:2OG-Fe(II) oxygenase family protein [Steroidobacteraceae bacterium]
MAQPPVIDISDAERAHVHRAIDAACRDWGVFQIVGHGIDRRLFAALRRQMRALFGAPLADKLAISRTAANPWGFYDRELTRHTRDWKQVYDYGPADERGMTPQWPAALPAFRPIVLAFYEACDALSLRLLRVLARNLGMPPESLDVHFRPVHTSFLRFNYYPRCPQPVKPLGVNAHTDAGALTLLLQDLPGLEVLHDGAWCPIDPRADALTVNIGDVVQVWSNDRYVAPLHRVLASDAERFSAPFFFNPSYATNYAPLPSVVDSRHPPRYRPINWREFRARRAAGDYADAGEYLQISRYAL